MNEMITIRPRVFQNTVALVATSLMFTSLGWIAVIFLLVFLGEFHPSDSERLPRALVTPILVLAAAPGFVFSLWFARKMLNKQYWQLTDTDLSCGISRQQKFPLSSIEKVIVGLPVGSVGKMFQRANPGTVGGAALAVLSTIDPRWNTVNKLYQAHAAKENSLLICFRNGSCLPLRLFLLPNGTTLMNDLRERLKDRLVHDYNYSAEEIRKLRRRDVNELIP